MSYQDSIFIFDLHNTIYDEVLEYGLAMKAALDSFGVKIDTQEVARAHALLGSDWHEDVWKHVPAVEGLDIQKAADVRKARSRELMKETAFVDTIEGIHQLKDQGARVYISTEATANAAAEAVIELELDGVIDGVYSLPYAEPFEKLTHTPQHDFPGLLQKPHPALIGQIFVNAAGLPDNAMQFTTDNSIDVSPLQARVTDGNAQAQRAIEALQTRLVLDEELKAQASKTYFVGDSFFKDGFMAAHAGVHFIHAAYGKKVANPETFNEARSMLYAVTGWEPFLLQLTHEAEKLPELTNRIRPYYVCKDSFKEFMDSGACHARKTLG